jgi:hypothetical protein
MGGRRTERYSKSTLTRLAKSHRIADFRLQTERGPSGPYFQVIEIATWNIQALYWQLQDRTIPSHGTLEGLSQVEGFAAGYRCAAEDFFWQSEESIHTYEAYERPHRHLEKVKDPTFGELKIDTRGNPGRRSPYPGMWLQSCWQMWFGPAAFCCLPVTRLVDFKGAQVRRLPGGTVFVQLYEEPFDYDVKENRRLQADFRRMSGMDELEARGLEAGRKAADPSFEISEGTFAKGGVRRLTEWVGNNGHPVPRSAAKRRIEVELDPAGHEISREEHDLG